METKVYKYKNGTIYVTLPKSFDKERLKLATEDFLKKVFNNMGHETRNKTNS